VQTLAAVFRRPGADFEFELVELDQPRADEVLLRVVGVGVCHTDVVFRDMHESPLLLPAVLGHEGAGIVESVGAAVKKVKPGDRVVMTFRSCGVCSTCKRGEPSYCVEFIPMNLMGRRLDGSCAVHDRGGADVGSNFFAQSSFSQYALAYERNLVKVPDNAPLELLGPLGCGVQTGAGATMRALACRRGSSILILGGGAVGLSAMLGAVIQGCTTIIVSEPLESRRKLALTLGATHVINPNTVGDVPAAVRAILRGGVNYAFDSTARAPVIADGINSLARRGAIGLVGMPDDPNALLSANMNLIVGLGATIRGIVEGDSNPDEFIPQLVDLFMAGKFPVDKLITTYPMRDINRAVADQISGKCVKAVLLPDSSLPHSG
jgi:aryl-alcohol dehydrogenase